MNKRRGWVIGLFTFWSISILYGQISPGKLAAAHSQLEGISNCTQCHELGKQVSTQKCLDCHQELKTRIDKNKGYHASSEVKAVSCFTCHSEHHGVKFEIVRFDAKQFNHKLTGYPLTGKHEASDCNNCHKSEYISDAKIRSKDFTYLGLTDQCNICHEDVHRATLDRDCNKCHTTEKFAPASRFKHKDTDYPLTGKHLDLKCESCHKKEEKDRKPFQVFTGIKFSQCSSCHEDVHKKRFGPSCNTCHNDQSFSILNSHIEFNHSITGYTLKGKHKLIDCSSCHKNSLKALSTAFQDFSKTKIEGCIQCHEDIHENKFGQNCVQCHTEQSFKLKEVPTDFDHDLTQYRLEGKHELIDCKKCHISKMTDPIVHDQCMNCHEDYHKGQFVKNNLNQDCAACHTVQNFSESTYGLDQHDKSDFPLNGAHMATSCVDCHLKKDKWTFARIGTQCIDCHEDVHNGKLDNKFYPEKKCLTCHEEASWQDVEFDHALTDFALKGKHASIKCNDCHLLTANKEPSGQVFALASNECISCHEDIHKDQFNEQGKVNCAQCHDFEQWKIPQFNHDQTAFSLSGAHKNVACDQCHRQIEINGVNCTQYKLLSFKCIDCHL